MIGIKSVDTAGVDPPRAAQSSALIAAVMVVLVAVAIRMAERLTMTKIVILATFVCGFLGLTPAAWAQRGLDRCNDILRQDLFNKVHSSSQASTSERAAYAEYVYSLNDTEAYAEYLDAYKSSKKESDSGKLGGGYGWGFISGEGEFAHSYDRQLSETEFSTKFNKNKAEHQKNSSSSSAKDASLISVYHSSVRDAGSVKAWEHCMATKYPEPGLFAYGYRDRSGNPYIVVMWVPGTFAAANPVIKVKLNVTEPGMTIDGAAGPVDIDAGSGAAYPIRFGNPNDKNAQADGFAVLVNGELKSGGRLVQSFRSEAIVPRNVGPIPCSVVFTASRSFVIGIFDTVAKAMNWNSGLGFSMLGRTEQRTSKLPGPFIPSPPGDPGGDRAKGRRRGSFGPSAVNSYNAKLSLPGATDEGLVQLNVIGTEFELTDPDGSVVFMTGKCTGHGIEDARMHTRSQTINEISIKRR